MADHGDRQIRIHAPGSGVRPRLMTLLNFVNYIDRTSSRPSCRA